MDDSIGFLIKVKYSCVHSDNYQGGMGKVVIQEDFLRVDHDTGLYAICEHAHNFIDGLTTKENFPIENPRLISMEIIETK